jgi:hypothetical protein
MPQTKDVYNLSLIRRLFYVLPIMTLMVSLIFCLNNVLLRYLLFTVNCDESHECKLDEIKESEYYTSRHYAQVRRAIYTMI